MGAPQTDRQPVGNWYRAAIFCGAAPLLTGIGTFLLWTVTRWSFLMEIGVWVLVAGLGFFVAGCIALGMHVATEAKALHTTRRDTWARGLRAFFLLLVNFPAVAVILSTAVFLETQYTITIRNRTSHPIEQARVEGGGASVDFTTIPPGASGQEKLHFMDDGSLWFTARYQGQRIERQIEGYVTSGLGGNAEVILTEKNRLQIEIRNRRDGEVN